MRLVEYGEIDYYFDNPDQFFFVSQPEDLRSTRFQLSHTLDILGDIAINCQYKPSTKCQGALPPIVLSGVPPRLAWVKLPLDGRRAVVGTVPVGKTRRLRWRGVWGPWKDFWQPPDGWFYFQIVSQDGSVRGPFPLRTPSREVANSGDRVEVWLQTNSPSDNPNIRVENPTDPGHPQPCINSAVRVRIASPRSEPNFGSPSAAEVLGKSRRVDEFVSVISDLFHHWLVGPGIVANDRNLAPTGAIVQACSLT